MKMFLSLLGVTVGSAALAGCTTTVPEGMLVACQNGIVEWASQYDAVRIDTVSTGRAEVVADGGLATPLHVRIIYARKGGYETREADVKCNVNESGAVVSMM